MLTRRQVLTGAAAAAGAAALPAVTTGTAALAGGLTRPFGLGRGQRRPAARRRHPLDPAVDGAGGRGGLAPPPGAGQLAGRHRRAVPADRAARPDGGPPGAGALGARRRRAGWSRPASTSTGSGRSASSARSAAPAPRPRRGHNPRALRFGIVNCQDFQNGYWPAYCGAGRRGPRCGACTSATTSTSTTRTAVSPTAGTPRRRRRAWTSSVTLDDYRNRHAQYKTDPALQAAHAAFPWIVTWDDHETENNYAALIDEIDDTGAAHADRGAVRPAARGRVPGVLRAHADPRQPAARAAPTCGSSGGSTSAGCCGSTCSTPGSTAPTSRAASPATSGPAEAGAGNTRRHADRRATRSAGCRPA